jgi:DNA primase
MTSLGYSLDLLQKAGLVSCRGRDTFSHRIVFPLENNLYGRSTGAAAPHRFLPAPKGGFYGWHRVEHDSDLILIEGLFDFISLHQAGFHNVACSLGSRLNALQHRQLHDGVTRTVYLAFDADGGGQRAARQLADSLSSQRVTPRIVSLPDGHDPNSFFVNGGTADDFRRLLRQALP